MTEQPAELPRAAPPDLRALVRRARLDDAERSSVIAELRGGELARLELLRDALEPVFAQVPARAEMFDHGLVPGEKPRLFVDIVSFVEMARDRRCYRFIQDTRAGTAVLAESDRIETMTQEVANYLARRLIEREKALSTPFSGSSMRVPDEAATGEAAAALAIDPAPAPASQPPQPARRRSGWAIFAALILGGIVGAALALAYSAGQLDQLWHIHW